MENEQKFADFLPPLFTEALTAMAEAFAKIRYMSLRPQTAESKQLVHDVCDALHNLPDMLAGKSKLDEQYIRKQIAICNKLIHGQG